MSRRRARTSILGAGLATAAVTLLLSGVGVGTAAADPEGCGITCAGGGDDGGYEVGASSVTITVWGGNAAGGGQSTYSVPGPLPPCRYTFGVPASEITPLNRYSGGSHGSAYENPAAYGYDPATLLPWDHAAHLTEDGLYWIPSCQGATDAEVDAFFLVNHIAWVPTGTPPPPPPPLGVEILLDIARDNLQAPAPDVDVNPAALSYVNLPTWVWTDPATFQQIGVRAQSGPNWAEITAEPSGMSLTSPAGEQQGTCASGGTPYTAGATTTDCALVFERASVGRPGWNLVVRTTWVAAYTDSEGGAGPLDGETAATTVVVPAAEVQALVRR